MPADQKNPPSTPAPKSNDDDTEAGIRINPDCIGNGTCKMNAYETLQIRDESD